MTPSDDLHDRAGRDVVAATKEWLEKAVIGLDLCPFAKAVHLKQLIRYRVSAANDPEALLADLIAELRLLAEADPGTIDTTLLIHPWTLADFLEYNEFLGIADAALADLRLAEVLQIASFHPRYQFAGAGPDDIENYTNRSPYPILHLLRQSSVDRAVMAFPDPAKIYAKNMATLRRLGHEGWQRLGLAATPAGPGESTSAAKASSGDDPLSRMADLAVKTGNPDLATNADHYLYGHPKASDAG